MVHSKSMEFALVVNLTWSILWQFAWPLETTCSLSKCFDHGVVAAVRRLDVRFLFVRLPQFPRFFLGRMTF